MRVEVANMIADQLAPAGIELGITTVTLTEMTERLSAGSYDLALVAYAMERMGRGEPRDLQDICQLDAQARHLAREKAAQLERVWR